MHFHARTRLGEALTQLAKKCPQDQCGVPGPPIYLQGQGENRSGERFPQVQCGNPSWRTNLRPLRNLGNCPRGRHHPGQAETRMNRPLYQSPPEKCQMVGLLCSRGHLSGHEGPRPLLMKLLLTRVIGLRLQCRRVRHVVGRGWGQHSQRKTPGRSDRITLLKRFGIA